MERKASLVKVVMVAFLASAFEGVTSFNTGAGIIYRLNVRQDVSLERVNSNFNYLRFLMVSKHPQYANKRSLVQFEDPPRACKASHIHSAKMYLYYVYAHKASWHSHKRSPFIPRYMEVYMVKRQGDGVSEVFHGPQIGCVWTVPTQMLPLKVPRSSFSLLVLEVSWSLTSQMQ